MDRYEFYKNKKGKLICNAVINGESVSYFDEDALYFFRRLGKEEFSSFRVEKKKKKKKTPPQLLMSNDYNMVVCRDCYKFKHLLNKYYSKNINKIDDELSKKAYSIAFGTGAIAIVTMELITLFGHDMALQVQREKSEEMAGSTISSYDETNTDNINFQVGEEVIEVEKPTFIYDNATDTEKFKFVEEKYGILCDELGGKYGVSPELLLAMITQESGGQDRNLMQIEFDNCADEIFTLDNFLTGGKEKIVLTHDKSKYDDSVLAIDSEMYLKPEYNLLSAIAILQKCFDYFPRKDMAIQAYNFGYGNMKKLLKIASEKAGISEEDIINGDSAYWLKCRDEISAGDSKYVEHILMYCKGDIYSIHINRFDDSNTLKVGRK